MRIDALDFEDEIISYALMPTAGNLSGLLNICQDISALCFSTASINIGRINRVGFKLFVSIAEGEMN